MYSEYRQERMLRHHKTPRKPAICSKQEEQKRQVLKTSSINGSVNNPVQPSGAGQNRPPFLDNMLIYIYITGIVIHLV